MDEGDIDKIDIGALFQFDQFKLLLTYLFKTQKTLTNRIKELESKMNQNGKIYTQSLNFIQMQLNDFTGMDTVIPVLIQEDITEKKTDENEDSEMDVDQNIMKNRSQSVTAKIAPSSTVSKPRQSFFGSQLPLSSIASSSSTSPTVFNLKHLNVVIKMINNRLKTNEAKISELYNIPKNQSIVLKHHSTVPTCEIDNEKKVSMDKRIEELEQMILEVRDKTKNLDIFEILENVKDGDGNQIETTKILIKALERKVFTKFHIVDEKVKEINDNLAERYNCITNNGKINLNQEGNCFNDNNNNKVSEDFEDIVAFHTKALEDINEKLLQIQPEEIQSEINQAILLLEDKINKEFKQKETSILDKAKLVIGNNPIADGKLSSAELFNLQNETKALIKKSIEESEKYIKSQISGLSIETLRKDIQSILKTLTVKLEKKDFQDIYHKLDSLNDSVLEEKKQIENNNIEIENSNKMIDRLVKKLEFLNGIVFSKKVKDQNTSPTVTKETVIDPTKFITQTQLSQLTSSCHLDIEKLAKEAESLKRIITQIEDKIRLCATESDMKNLEHCFFNELDEYKITALKKFSDKAEMNKSFKYLETQIRHYLNQDDHHNNKMETNKEWLIAKKPIDLFHCASCDSYIGELNNTVKYSPWKKIPMRDEVGKYRVRILTHIYLYL